MHKQNLRIEKIWGEMVFDDKAMEQRLPKKIYNSFKKAVENYSELNQEVAESVALAMKEWAIEKGATHFTHWFQPMTGITAEKHDSFISLDKNGKTIVDFSGKELLKGEPDASSFPSGGLRATFEARGYTAWDPTSYAFVKDGTLCIPTVFCSYGGEVLDKKTPLLRSIRELNNQALRVLKLFGVDNAKRVFATVGVEQEYFLVDKKVAEKRKDLIYCGRTLFGAKPVKGQDLGDHYFGYLRPRVSKFMKDLDFELWRLGVPVKTEHNEVAPAQHELAQIYTHANTATDQNQITMEVLKLVAERHGMVCLLNEKPFAGVNGSGKHNNWSLQTDNGINLLEPGNSPDKNAQFLLFLCAIIKGIDEYPELLRISVASAGNDHRLGAQEAPPAIISIFVGEELTEVLKSIENGGEYGGYEKHIFETGVDVLPKFPKDTTDRNRTSPFAFTGNKFEFRMVGSNESISCANMMLNTIVADELAYFADRLENCENFQTELNKLLSETIKNHKKIIFNGNNYSREWRDEAQKRNLPDLKTMADAIPHYLDKKNIELFERRKILSRKEIESRCDIQMENYLKVLNIEVLAMIEITKKDIIPSVINYIGHLSKSLNEYKKACPNLDRNIIENLIEKLSGIMKEIGEGVVELIEVQENRPKVKNKMELGKYYKETIIPSMEKLRKAVDAAENNTAEEYWPYPTYSKLLFSLQ